MIVTVKYFVPNLREITQKRKEEIEVPSVITVRKLMDLLSKKYDHRFKDYVYNEKGRTPHLLFLVVGRNTVRSQGLKTRLEDRDEVLIVNPMGGG